MPRTFLVPLGRMAYRVNETSAGEDAMRHDDIARRLRGTAAERVLMVVADAGGMSPFGDVASVLGSNAAVSEAKAQLKRLGLLESDESISGELTLSARGGELAEDIRSSRESGVERLDRVARAIGEAALRGRSGQAWRVDEVDGRPVTDNEVAIVMDWFARWECATVFRSGRTIVRIIPKDRMREFPTIPGLLRDHYHGPSRPSIHRSVTNTTTISGSTVGGVQTGGSGNVQHDIHIVAASERAELLAIVDQVLSALDTDPNDEVRDHVDVIRGEVLRDKPNKDAIRDRATQALITAGATGATNLVFQGLTRLLEILTR